MTRIPEIELCFSNACTASCFICSRTHGGNNDPFMSLGTFRKAVERMRSIDFDIIQTGGDGDSFLNPIYLSALYELREAFPGKKVVLYSNFALLTPDIAAELIMGNLIDDLYTRVDSLDPTIFMASTGLDMETAFGNIDYFLSKNKKIKFQVNYSNIKRYRGKCHEVLGKTPLQWNGTLESAPDDEFDAICSRFGSKGTVRFDRIRQSLWAERNDPAIEPEPDIPCGRQYCFEGTCYIWPNGNVGICGYDDGQDALIVGNIHEQPLEEIWTGERRREMIEAVARREIKGYPCVNPKACLFH